MSTHDLTADAPTPTTPSIWFPTTEIIKTPGFLLYELAPDGDAYLTDSSTRGDQVLIRVSSRALSKTTRFFRAQFTDYWMPASGKFTPENPLVLAAEGFDSFVVFLRIASEEEACPRPVDCVLDRVAMLLDKYLFEGKLPAWYEETLNSFFPRLWPFANFVDHDIRILEDTGRIPVRSNLTLLHCAYLLDLPSVFATASRRMMWQSSIEEVETLTSQNLEALFPCDFLGGFTNEAVRLRVDLVSKLPSVFYPDPHTDDDWWCHDCQFVPHEERWHREIISKSDSWGIEQKEGMVYRLGDLFMEYIHGMTRLERLREIEGPGSPAFGCRRFRLRYLDVTEYELLFDVYRGIGGLCLPCIKAGGKFEFRSYCSEHNLDLTEE
ncbi:hypothetical protein CLAIMM_08780 isoform 2 [Cladophialophora immunda]|nr:hypothetical protein CLAIMM_08780 isoform 1 [Cladophialophora immunda]OQV03780.1 hypothetical protein CLAIMM_08780 isoform 2 [Cladophialophora immunda]